MILIHISQTENEEEEKVNKEETSSSEEEDNDKVVESVNLDEEAESEAVQYTSKGPVFRGSSHQGARHNPYGRMVKVIKNILITPSS